MRDGVRLLSAVAALLALEACRFPAYTFRPDPRCAPAAEAPPPPAPVAAVPPPFVPAPPQERLETVPAHYEKEWVSDSLRYVWREGRYERVWDPLDGRYVRVWRDGFWQEVVEPGRYELRWVPAATRRVREEGYRCHLPTGGGQ
jgi:hypothetical protein